MAKQIKTKISSPIFTWLIIVSIVGIVMGSFLTIINSLLGYGLIIISVILLFISRLQRVPDKRQEIITFLSSLCIFLLGMGFGINQVVSSAFQDPKIVAEIITAVGGIALVVLFWGSASKVARKIKEV